MPLHYFAADGNFGNADELVIVDTSDWVEEDWERMEEAYDFQKPYVASSIRAYKVLCLDPVLKFSSDKRQEN